MTPISIPAIYIGLEELVRNVLVSGADIVGDAMADMSEGGPWREVKEMVDGLLSDDRELIASLFRRGCTTILMGKKFAYVEEMKEGDDFVIVILRGREPGGKLLTPHVIHSNDVEY